MDQIERTSGFSKPNLTICTVVFRDKWCLDLNWELTSQLNDGCDFVWLVVRNKPIQPEEWSPATKEKYQLIEGVEPDIDPAHKNRHGSYQHAAGLNLIPQYVKTRFILFLDADCFLMRPNWIRDVLNFMLRYDLTFFGLPYHPQNFIKIRYFPCGLCLFVDTSRVNLSEFDWTPELDPVTSPAAKKSSLFYQLLKRVMFRLGMGQRFSIGTSEDTGIRIYRKYINRTDIKYEYATPVFKPIDLGFDQKQLTIEKFLPERFCFVPKDQRYFTGDGFATNGLLDVASMGCEEYMWLNAPFAFHVRGSLNQLKNEQQCLTNILMSFLNIIPLTSSLSD